MKLELEGVTVETDFHCSIDEARNYLNYVREHVTPDTAANLSTVKVKLCEDDFVDVSYSAYNRPFERIRRITGYLVGTIDRWNDAKQAEEHDRVKHDPNLRRLQNEVCCV